MKRALLQIESTLDTAPSSVDDSAEAVQGYMYVLKDPKGIGESVRTVV